jgi:hypothetical protein
MYCRPWSCFVHSFALLTLRGDALGCLMQGVFQRPLQRFLGGFLEFSFLGWLGLEDWGPDFFVCF